MDEQVLMILEKQRKLAKLEQDLIEREEIMKCNGVIHLKINTRSNIPTVIQYMGNRYVLDAKRYK